MRMMKGRGTKWLKYHQDKVDSQTDACDYTDITT